MCILSNKNAFNPQLLKAAAGICSPEKTVLKRPMEFLGSCGTMPGLFGLSLGFFHAVQLRKVQFVSYIADHSFLTNSASTNSKKKKKKQSYQPTQETSKVHTLPFYNYISK